MHENDEFLDKWRREHSYLGITHGRNETRTRIVLVLTLVTMVGEIAAGLAFGSMALLADGWHMGSHAAALGLASLAYLYARRHAESNHYSFGTGKVGDLAGFSSALLLIVVAAAMAMESVKRFFTPVAIAYDQALMIAVLGLAVNLISAWILGGDHGHDHHDADLGDTPEKHDHDNNFRAVYVHVLTDALTSVLAIAALIAGRFRGWDWLDPAVGIVGALVIGRWAWTLVRSTARVLLDTEPIEGVNETVRAAIESESDNRIADLHVWRLGPGHIAAMLTVVTHQPQPPGHYKKLLCNIPGLSHVTIEVEACDQHPPRAGA